eukprot:SAG11_NODE_15435_length_578_cov_1.475992_2_plen_88_part_00
MQLTPTWQLCVHTFTSYLLPPMKFADATGLACLGSLVRLRLTSNKLKSLSFCAGLGSLEQLFVQANAIGHMVRDLSVACLLPHRPTL